MASDRFDVLVVGSGPAGSIAALVLARGGARVALVDKSPFPRDKACGDLVGPRGVRLLDDLAVDVPGAAAVDDMVVVGPTGRRVRLPCYPGDTYPGHALAVPRARFDACLHDAAVSAGARPIAARVDACLSDNGSSRQRFSTSSGPIDADVVIGADGATSRVADAVGLVDPARVLWGFALRAYAEDPVRVPHIILWEQARWRAFPGYGWLFPGVDGRANLGLGVGLLSDRRGAHTATHAFDAFAAHLARAGVLTRPPAASPRLGGWLKMGMVGTTPARGRVLLVGDAAGLVNPLQGEGIAQAMASGRAAADAVLAGVDDAPARYLAFLARTYAPYHSATAPLHAALVGRPVATAAVGRILTLPGASRAIAGTWSVFWNDLIDGATHTTARRAATAAGVIGRTLSAKGRTRRWFDTTVRDQAVVSSPR